MRGAVLQMGAACGAVLQYAAVQMYHSTIVLLLAVQMYYSKNTTFKKRP
jgi:spore maturation protein SpmB